MSRNPASKDVKRLQGLARRVERLWQLAQRRLEISEREVARHIDVWQAPQRVEASGAVTREQVESALHDPESPYQRLRLVMDAWCALWFWPLDAGVDPPSLEEWMATITDLIGAEAALGKKHTAGQLDFIEHVRTFAEMAEADRADLAFHNAKKVNQTVLDHPWLGVVHEIADREGFFHWELDFAHIFARGGFDLQVGNPPWVRPIWEDDLALAEFDAWFGLEKPPVPAFNARRTEILREPGNFATYLEEVASGTGLNESLSSPAVRPLLAGIQTNLYMVFMDTVWQHAAPTGVASLVHPEGHFNDPKGGHLRRATYRHLRRHFNFMNGLFLFEDVHHITYFGIHVYGHERHPLFLQLSYLQHPAIVDGSLKHDGSGDLPGIQYPQGGWDLRPHKARVLTIDAHVLASWAQLFDDPGTPPAEARLLRPITTADLEALEAIANQPIRLADHEYHWSSGFHERGAKEAGLIRWETRVPSSWDEVIVQGPHFTVATPLAKQPNENCRHNQDYSSWNLERLPKTVIPRTNYQRAASRDRYEAAVDHWDGTSSSKYWRTVWRKMTQPGLERSLHPALLLPGPAHIDGVYSLAGTQTFFTTTFAGLCATLPFDYLVKLSGKSNIHDELVRRFPMPRESPYISSLVLRTLRLNCLTRDYAPLWEELFDSAWQDDRWTDPGSTRPPLGAAGPEWTTTTPLRLDYDRRMALVELDALAALILGLMAEQLCAMYRTQFPVLRKYEYRMYFDAQGRKIAKDHQTHGVEQQTGDYELVDAWVDDPGSVELPDRYQPPFTKPDREAEMRVAYAEFERRLAAEGGDP